MTVSPGKKQRDEQAAAGMAASGIYSEVPEVVQKLMALLPAWERSGFRLEDARPIPYGTQISFRNGEAELRANMYYSKKKGFSLVISPKTRPI